MNGHIRRMKKWLPEFLLRQHQYQGVSLIEYAYMSGNGLRNAIVQIDYIEVGITGLQFSIAGTVTRVEVPGLRFL